ncbi:protein of unknown function [Candidatus Hydrogenisulfobacillus filiaventi]|uniref:Uncharacterized protein n=1 Tax=Candidatus Hydrogenisulfobacillus filiaventi TaxID=2707344 RepID=A0A6F8ZG22_9FIRM|nr:hypothetical protein [Bacillota bacterium]CAB1128412.1 protein of unknown function [Candidatus Hydrogenisulfobacillus filiaventi]
MPGLVWWIGYGPRPPAGQAGGFLDAGLGLRGAPLRETVLSALATGANPAPVTGPAHRRGRPDPAWAAWLRQCGLGSRLAAAGRPVRGVTAWPPAAFRGSPAVEMLLAPDPPATLGDLRRGLALAPDVTGTALAARGHHGLPLRDAPAAAALLAGLLQRYAMLIFVAARAVDADLAGAVLAGVTAAGGQWLAVAVPDRPADAGVAWAAGRDPGGPRPRGVTDLAAYLIRMMEEGPEGA